MRNVGAWLLAHGTETESAVEHPHGTAFMFLTAAGVLLAAVIVNWLRVRHARSVATRKIKRKSEVRELEKRASKLALLHGIACAVALAVAGYGWYLFNEGDRERRAAAAAVPEAVIQSPAADARFPLKFLATDPSGAFVIEVRNKTKEMAFVQCEITPLGADGEPVSEGTFTRIDAAGEEMVTDVYTTRLQVPPDQPVKLDVEHEVSAPPARWEGGCEELAFPPG